MDKSSLKALLVIAIVYGLVAIIKLIFSSPNILKKMNPTYGEFKIKVLVEERKRDMIYDVMISFIGLMSYLWLKWM